MIYINEFASISALGSNSDEITYNLSHPNQILLTKRNDLLLNQKESYFGQVKASLPSLEAYPKHKTRNNALLAYLCQVLKEKVDYFIEKYGNQRVGIVLGTSTSGLSETEVEIKNYLQTNVHSQDFYFSMQEFGDPALFLAQYLGIKGVCYAISTACSSSSKALVSAKKLIEKDVCDVVIAGGADTLCAVPINGFDSMQVLSSNRCNPFCKHRDGINIGEAAGLMILSKDPSSLALVGCGESSDAYHISSPDPEGKGAIKAINMALKDANLTPNDIGYINMHGTGTKLNDAMESKAVNAVFGNSVPSSSTKYLTGHTLGGAGILESCILAYILKYDLNLPPQDFSFDEIDDTLLDCGLLKESVGRKTNYLMSNSFAFGGNNTSIIIGKVDE